MCSCVPLVTNYVSHLYLGHGCGPFSPRLHFSAFVMPFTRKFPSVLFIQMYVIDYVARVPTSTGTFAMG